MNVGDENGRNGSSPEKGEEALQVEIAAARGAGWCVSCRENDAEPAGTGPDLLPPCRSPSDSDSADSPRC